MPADRNLNGAETRIKVLASSMGKLGTNKNPKKTVATLYQHDRALNVLSLYPVRQIIFSYSH